MAKKIYTCTAKVYKYPGMDGWHFINVSKSDSTEIKENYCKHRRGFGSIPIEITLGKTKWQTSIFPSKLGYYLLPLKAKVRRAEDIHEGDTVTFSFKIR